MTETTEASSEEINGDKETTMEPVNDVPESENRKDDAVVVVDDPNEAQETPQPNGEDHEPQADADEKKEDEPLADAQEKEDDEPIAEADEKKDDDEPPTTTNSESHAENTPEAPVSDAPESVPAATEANTTEEATVETSPSNGVETAPENHVSTPVSSPARPSSTPERPSSLSSTPERASFDQQQQSSTFEVQDDDTWSQITKRDRPLSNANAIAVMDHAHTVLEKRISDATDDRNMKDKLRIFQQSLGRFQNSEIKLGRRCVIYFLCYCVLQNHVIV